MKYGIIMFKNTKNLGDDIQTYAQMKYLPRIDYVIEREKLDCFTPNKTEDVFAIISGWFIHNQTSFPISPFINPLYISCHFTDYLKGKKPLYMDDDFFKSIKKFEPIGLRDNLCKKYLDENNIKNYFSGCLTLTIDPIKNVKKRNQICLVDVDNRVEYKMKDLDIPYILTSHDINNNINEKLSFEERMENVKSQLRLYQESKLVITSRLHVALPCLAIGANVLLIYDENNIDVKNRLGSYLDLLNYTSVEDFIKNPNFDYKNSKKYLKLRKGLETVVENHIKELKPRDLSLENLDYFKKYYVNKKDKIDNIYNEEINDLRKELSDLYVESGKLFMQRNAYLNNIKFMQKPALESFKLKHQYVNSIYYKIRTFLKKIKNRIKGEK